MSMRSADDARVVRAIGGDGDALSELLREYGPEVERNLQIGAVWQALIEPSDVMQVTYLEAFLRIRSFDPARGTPFSAWLRAIAQNNLRDAIRGLSRQKEPPPHARLRAVNHEDSLVGLYDLLATVSTTPSARLRREELCGLVEQAVAALPERYAQVVRLYDLEAHTIEEVSSRLGRSPGAVYMLRARAHERLSEMLAGSSGIFP